MNFLAHMFLTHGDKELTVGNYIADFIRNRDLVLFSSKIIEGVMLHRHIDYFTDNHPEVLKSTRILRERHGKYAPVVIDVFYDYILAHNWKLFSDFDKRSFADTIYLHLNEFSDTFPIHLQSITSRMIADDFLLQYGTKVGIEKTLRRIGKRAKFESNFDTAFQDLDENFEEINTGFLNFFPDLINEVKNFEIEN